MILSLALSAGAARGDALGVVERVLAWRYPVPQIEAAAMASAPRDTRPLLFDVRRADEYAVSHLPDAIRISPARDADDFLREYRARLHGRGAVFYCTVGARSSRLAAAVRERLTAADRSTVYNLRGGILRWQAADLPLVNAAGPTSWAHPYDATWARLAPRADQLSKVPHNDPAPARR